MLTSADCDALDHAHDVERNREDRCTKNVTAPSGILIGCARDAGHEGRCRTRGGIEGRDPHAIEQRIPVVALRPELRTLFDSCSAIGFDLSLFESRVPDAEPALRLWAAEHDLHVEEEDRIVEDTAPIESWRGMRVSIVRVRLPDMLTISVHRSVS